MFKVKTIEIECLLSYSKQSSPYGETPIQILLTTPEGRTWVVDWELLQGLIVPIDGDAEVFLEGIRQRMIPPTVEEQIGMRMMPREDGGFELRNVTKPK